MVTKVGVIGVGGWGKNHARVLKDLGCLAAICDLDAARAKEIADRHGAQYYSSVDEMLNKEGVSIGMPSGNRRSTSTHRAKTMRTSARMVRVAGNSAPPIARTHDQTSVMNGPGSRLPQRKQRRSPSLFSPLQFGHIRAATGWMLHDAVSDARPHPLFRYEGLLGRRTHLVVRPHRPGWGGGAVRVPGRRPRTASQPGTGDGGHRY